MHSLITIRLCVGLVAALPLANLVVNSTTSPRLMRAHVISQELTPRDRFADSARREIEAASLAGDIARLQGARAMLERALTAFPNDPLLQHYQGYSLYREATLMQGMQRRIRARPLCPRRLLRCERGVLGPEQERGIARVPFDAPGSVEYEHRRPDSRAKLYSRRRAASTAEGCA